MTAEEYAVVKPKQANGGARKGAGRMKKVQSLQMVELMDSICSQAEMWEMLANKCKQGDVTAIKLWLAYNVGQPLQVVQQTNINVNASELTPAKLKSFNKELEQKY